MISIKCSKSALAVLLALSFVVAPAAAGQKQAPGPGPARPFRLPTTSELKLENGLTLVMIEDRRTPMFTINVAMPVGTANDPAGDPGLAEAAAELLTQGAGSRTAEQLTREVETFGGRLVSSASADYTEVESAAVAENAERILEIVGDVLLRPTFAENEVALYKENRLQKLTVERQDPAFLVSEHFDRVVYGAHPYAISSPTLRSINALSRAKVERFYRTRYGPRGAVIVMVGDFDPAKMGARARAIFGGWKTVATAGQKFAPPVGRRSRRIYLIDRPDSEQADFRIGNLAVARRDTDYFALLVANAILGGGASSRLFLNIREQKGYSYDVFSALDALAERGTFFGGSQTRTEVTLPAIREMLAEFDRLRNEKVSQEDLRNAKNYLSGVFSLILSTQGGVADQVLATYMLGLEPGHLESYRARIEAVTADDVQRVARRYIQSASPAIIVVGDAAKLKRALQGFAPVEVFDTEGKPVRRAAPPARKRRGSM